MPKRILHKLILRIKPIPNLYRPARYVREKMIFPRRYRILEEFRGNTAELRQGILVQHDHCVIVKSLDRSVRTRHIHGFALDHSTGIQRQSIRTAPFVHPHVFALGHAGLVAVMAVEHDVFRVRFRLFFLQGAQGYRQVFLEDGGGDVIVGVGRRYPFFHVFVPCFFPFWSVVDKYFFTRLNIARGHEIQRQTNRVPEFQNGNPFLQPIGIMTGRPVLRPHDLGIRLRAGSVIDVRRRRSVRTKYHSGLGVSEAIIQYHLHPDSIGGIPHSVLADPVQIQRGAIRHVQQRTGRHQPPHGYETAGERAASRLRHGGIARAYVVHASSALGEPIQIANAVGKARLGGTDRVGGLHFFEGEGEGVRVAGGWVVRSRGDDVPQIFREGWIVAVLVFQAYLLELLQKPVDPIETAHERNGTQYIRAIFEPAISVIHE
mmetsp:Transcript_28123/g.60377  ORF Transcript_28123/g.60377 Transcript_28123/m.60377 type:complete len:432 (+) Transcript_28123:281-1576(+)